jgi:hypothetical protein
MLYQQTLAVLHAEAEKVSVVYVTRSLAAAPTPATSVC